MDSKVLMYTFATPGLSEGFGSPMVSLKGFEKIENKDSKRFHELMNELKFECLKLEVHFQGQILETNDFDSKIDSKSLEPSILEGRANALLISKAPEMLEMLNKARSTILSLKGSMMAHPDCTEGSEFDDRTYLAENLESKIEQLIKEVTTN